MRILLDECVDRRLAGELKGHEVKAAPQMGWASTVDKKIPSQQDLQKFNLAIIVLLCSSNRLQDLKPLVPKLLASFSSAKKGQALRISQ